MFSTYWYCRTVLRLIIRTWYLRITLPAEFQFANYVQVQWRHLDLHNVLVGRQIAAASRSYEPPVLRFGKGRHDLEVTVSPRYSRALHRYETCVELDEPVPSSMRCEEINSRNSSTIVQRVGAHQFGCYISLLIQRCQRPLSSVAAILLCATMSFISSCLSEAHAVWSLSADGSHSYSLHDSEKHIGQCAGPWPLSWWLISDLIILTSSKRESWGDMCKNSYGND